MPRPVMAPSPTTGSSASAEAGGEITIRDLSVYYGGFRAVRDVNLTIPPRAVTAIIGPSGCGKSTFLRSLNRMNDIVPGARVEGSIRIDDRDIYASSVDVVDLRRRVGMVFQKSNPFPKSIFDNVAYGLRINGMTRSREELRGRVQGSLEAAALWDEVRDRLHASALSLSGGQQQRLCIARALAVEPDVILMDEPASALDPIATSKIEDLMHELKNEYTLVIVTHNMQQAARVADMTAFFTTELDSKSDRRTGTLVEYDATSKIFSAPSDERTENYITGRFG